MIDEIKDFEDDVNQNEVPNEEPEVEGEPEGYAEDEVVLNEESTAESSDIDEHLDEPASPKTASKKDNHHSVKNRLNKYTREKYESDRRAQKAEDELRKLREENEKLKRNHEMSSKAFLNAQDNLIESNIKHATQLKAKAREEGDVTGEIEADKMLAGYMADKRYIDNQKYNQQFFEEEKKDEEERRKQYEQQNNVQHQEQSRIMPPEAYDWFEENPWFSMENVDEYDPYLSEKAQVYSQYLEKKYAQEGRANQVFSHEYFADLDKYMAKHLNSVKPQGHQAQGALVMNRPKSPVASAGRTSQAANSQGNRHYLNKNQEQIKNHSNWKTEDWLKYQREGERLLREKRITIGSSRGN